MAIKAQHGWKLYNGLQKNLENREHYNTCMETWIMESVCWLFTFLSLFLRHKVVKAFITSTTTALFPPADAKEWTSTKRKKSL